VSHQVAFVFPGQGSQSVGMLGAFADAHPVVQRTFQEASEVLGFDVWELAQNGPAEKLNQTEFTQPALLAADIALWRAWLACQGERPVVMAGHSLGEYSALVAAEVMDFASAVELVATRGRLMQSACAQGEGAMAAIIGLDDEQVETVCAQCAQGDVLSPANYNSYGQVVIAGQAEAVGRAIVKAKEVGAKIAKLIPVSVPSHCLLMEPAQVKLADALAQCEFNTPTIPVIQNVDGETHTDPEAIRNALTQQLTQPVRFVQTIEKMLADNVDTFIECGPGKVLTGLIKRISKSSTLYSLGLLNQFQSAQEK